MNEGDKLIINIKRKGDECVQKKERMRERKKKGERERERERHRKYFIFLMCSFSTLTNQRESYRHIEREQERD